jgi:hypothetical protein
MRASDRCLVPPYTGGVPVARREEGPQGAVNGEAREHLALVLARLASQERRRDAAHRRRPLPVVHLRGRPQTSQSQRGARACARRRGRLDLERHGGMWAPADATGRHHRGQHRGGAGLSHRRPVGPARQRPHRQAQRRGHVSKPWPAPRTWSMPARARWQMPATAQPRLLRWPNGWPMASWSCGGGWTRWSRCVAVILPLRPCHLALC